MCNTITSNRYPSYVREQKVKEKQQNEKKTAVNEWQHQIKSNSLTKYLQRKDAEKS